MPKYNFDKIIDRADTYSFKWDESPKSDITPMWLADLDFQCAPEILEVLHNRIDHGIFGYSKAKDSYFQQVVSWYQEGENNFELNKDWICITPGIICALNYIIQIYTNRGDNILIQTPAYPPFFSVIQTNNRNVLTNKLVSKDNYYQIDFDDLELKIKRSKAFIFCSPHNPVSRVWSSKEIEKIIELCLKHDTLLISDEIHSDIIFRGYKHRSMFNYLDDIGNNMILCNSPSKSFNIPAFMLSNIFIPNDSLRLKFINKLNNTGFRTQNIMGLIACQAAYKFCRPWLKEMLTYIESNYNFLKKSLQTTNMKLTKSEGTFLAWIDCSRLGLDRDKIESLLLNKAKVMLSMGYLFGREFDRFVRINIGCPRSVLEKKVNDIKKYLN